MPLALTPNLKEESVSAALSKEGEQQMIRAVLAVPPNESCKALYGIGHWIQSTEKKVTQPLSLWKD